MRFLPGLLELRGSFRYRLAACVAVGLTCQAALAPLAAASMLPSAAADRPAPARNAAPSAATSAADRAAATPAATGTTPTQSPARAGDSVPQLWTPRAAVVVDASPPLSAESLFDGDATTGLTAERNTSAAVRLELGSARDLIGLGVHGAGRAKIALFAEDAKGVRTPIATGRDGAIDMASDRWAQLVPSSATKASALVVQWTAAPTARAAVSELALWVAGRSRSALAEAAIADRLVTELPENATAATAVPWSAPVARVTRQGSVSASFALTLNLDPRLGRAFLMYELDKKAHWTGVARSINGHAVRGGYRADAKGTGGVQVEEINPAWLERGDNTISFQPTQLEDGQGYSIRNVRVVSVPLGIDAPPPTGARTALSDGDLSTGVGGPGVHAASFPARADREPAFLSFYLDKPAAGTLTVSAERADGGRPRRKGQVNVDLDGRPAGWQTVPVAGVLPASSELRVRVQGDRESKAQVSEARVQSFPALASPADLTVSYPLHGECFDHKTYVRGFVSGADRLEKPQFFVDGQPAAGKIDADGSFEVDVDEPASAKGKPWSIRVDVTAEGAPQRTRTVPVDTCVEPPKGRIIGVSPPVEDVGAPYGAVVSPGKASTLSFAGARIEIPAGAVDSDVRVTMRALDRGQLAPLKPEMENVVGSGGALRFGPHGLQFKKPVKVTLPIDSARMPPGMTHGDVVGFFFDEASSKWTELPKLSGRPDQIVARTTHFTDFIAATVRTPDHPDAQQFNPNTMKGVKAGEPAAGITMIEPPVANSDGTARLSYPIETPPARNGIGPNLALTYDSGSVGANGWLGAGWDLRLSSVEIDTRFGVPRYNSADIYSLDGSMLTTTSPAGRYVRRVEGSFDRIERLGTGPTNYSWRVTDKAGTVYTYGTIANSRLANPRTGQPGAGNIFRWYLERVQDVFGNFMTITYAHDTFTVGTAPNAETFDEVYPSVIDYTGGPSLAANYHVEFRLDAVGTRPDTTITARSGFLVSTRRRLADVLVKSGTSVVRQYKFFYEPNLTNTMQKSLLSAVALWSTQDSASTELYRHTFEYNKAPAATAMFSAPAQWGQVVQAATPPATGTVPRTANGLSQSNDHLGGKAVTLGVGFPIISATGTYGNDSGSSTPGLAFLGLTGEGLPDQVDTRGTMSLNTLRGASNAHFLASSVTGLTALGSTSRSGWTAGGSISALSGLFGAGARYGRHVAVDKGIVTDINGDGFPDVVYANGGSLTAYVNDGKRNFTQKQWTNYNLSDSPFSTSDRVSQAGAAQSFNTDPLVRWVAPFGGTVTVNATVRKEDALDDDIRVDLYIANDPVRSVTIESDDRTVKTLASNVSKTVAAGDRVYFRLAALGKGISTGAQLTSSIVFTPPSGRTAAELDPTGSPIFNFQNQNDHRWSGMPRVTWTLTGNGDIGVGRCFSKVATPDDVKVSYVIRNPAGAEVRRFDKVFAATATGSSDSLCFDNAVLPASASNAKVGTITNVLADQTVSFEITSDSPVDPRNKIWASRSANGWMFYTRYCRPRIISSGEVCGTPHFVGSGPDGGGWSFSGDPWPNVPLTYDQVIGFSEPLPSFQTYVWRVFNNGTTTTPQPMRSLPAPDVGVVFGGTVTTTAALTEDVFVLIQGVNKLHKKVRIPAGTASGASFPVTTSTAIQVTNGEPVFFTIYSPTVIGGNVNWTPAMNAVPVAAANINKAILDPTFDNNRGPTRDPMSGGFRRWFYGDWNDSVPFNDSLIVRTATAPQNTDVVMGMIQLQPDADLPYWEGRGGAQVFSEDTLIPGRINNEIARSRNGSGMSALRVSDTWNLDLNGSVTGITAGGNGGDATTQIDFLDLNGDRFPDSITRSGVQYNDGSGSFSARQAVDAGFGDLRKTVNASFQVGVTVGGSDRHVVNESDGEGKTRRLSATKSLGGSLDYGVSATRVDFADVNGDGLEDHIRQDNNRNVTVKLNLGYGFSNELTWVAPANWSTSAAEIDFGGITAPNVGRLLNIIPNMTPNSTSVVRLQDTGTTSASLGVNLGVIGGGGGPTWSVTRTWVDLIDVNGDGLPDQVLKVPGQQFLRVKLNKGDRFDAEQAWTLPNWATSTSSNFSFLAPDGLAFSTMDGWGKNLNFQICFFVCFGMSGFSSDSSGGPSASFEDVNGDGLPDHVLKVPGDARVYAKLNNIYNTNLLAAVNRPFGSRFTIAYARSGNHVDLAAVPKMNMPTNRWVMNSVLLSSGNNQSWNEITTQTFDYNNAAGYGSGFVDVVEREDLGFGTVKTIFPSEDLNGTSIVQEFRNQNYYTRGLEYIKTWYQNNALSVRLRALRTSHTDPSGKNPDQQPPRTGTIFPAPTETRTEIYETSSTANTHIVSRTFDTNGNLTDVIDRGDANFSGFDDDYNYHIDYTTPAGTLITVPTTVTVRTGATAGAGTLLAKRTVTTLTAQGRPNGVTDVIIGGKNPGDGLARTEAAPANATSTFTYDAFGNVLRATTPNGASDGDGNPRTIEYTYDTTTRTYPVTTAQIDSDANFQYRSTAVYDLRFGLPTRIVDVSGARQEFDYDAYGRVTKVFAPTDFDASGNRLDTNAPSIGVTYSTAAHTAGAAETLPGWAMASHRSNAPAEGTLPNAALTTFRSMRTVNFVDGLNRSIQVKKDITRDDGTGATTAGMSVSGKTSFDARGRVYQQGQPIFIAGTGTPTAFASIGHILPTTFAYDVLGRVRRESRPDKGGQAVTTISYQKGVSTKDNREWVVKLTSDPLNAQNTSYHYRLEYQTVRGDVRMVAEPNLINGALKMLYTQYSYDPLGRLLSVMDAKNNISLAQYDSVGHLVALSSPDAGVREWRYCIGGYVCAEQSPNARNAGANVRIQYGYDRDRLISITYPNTTGNPGVTYSHGTAAETGAANGYKANRVKRRVDESGQVDYAYDALGNIASETALLKNTIAGGNYQSYQTQYKWDAFGRLIDVMIPGTTTLSTPAETIRYGYDAGGAVTSAWGRVGTTNHPYVRHVGYNEFGERVRIAYGNQAFSTYVYAPDTRRLTNANTTIQPTGQPATLTQSLSYEYDAVGNVKRRQQPLDLDPNLTNPVPLTGYSNLTFSYDPLNQLTFADLFYQARQPEAFFAQVTMSYDEIGNVKSKAVTDLGNVNGPDGEFIRGYTGPNNYTFTPTYAVAGGFNPGPHQPGSIVQVRPVGTSTRTVSYDRNGNAVSLTTNGSGRFITWTDTDRIRSMCEGTSTNCPKIAEALYNAEGTRTHNKVTQGTSTTETLYVNQNLTVRNGTLPTKHVYLGNARIASKTESNASTNNTYWFHSDHLNSTQYVTSANQALVQHLEYYPSGEIWREETDASKLRGEIAHATAFTGKELDASGYYYYGARYYDPQIQMWLSPDPILGQYIKGAPNGGVFQPRNLGLYTYSWNNPVVLTDPDGRSPNDPWYVRAGKEVLGLAHGVVLGFAPGGGLIRPDLPRDSDFLYGVALGQAGAAGIQMAGGTTLMGGGGAVTIGTLGTGAVVGVPAVAAGAYLGANGLAAGAGSIQTMKMAKDAANREAGGGGGQVAKAPSSRAARREVMRDQDIPTSQQPVSQSSNASGRSLEYEVPAPGGGTQLKSVQQQTMDSSHAGQPHWEAGSVKVDPSTGAPRYNQYGRPKLTNDKSKVNY